MYVRSPLLNVNCVLANSVKTTTTFPFGRWPFAQLNVTEQESASTLHQFGVGLLSTHFAECQLPNHITHDSRGSDCRAWIAAVIPDKSF